MSSLRYIAESAVRMGPGTLVPGTFLSAEYAAILDGSWHFACPMRVAIIRNLVANASPSQRRKTGNSKTAKEKLSRMAAASRCSQWKWIDI
jgi:hypothetical protein